MANKQKHRGQHAQDPILFQSKRLPVLSQAVEDLSWLLTRGYAEKSSLKLVGDRHKLLKRQRMAVMRAACSNEAAARRQKNLLHAAEIVGKDLVIDGYNLLITVEAGLAGGIVLLTKDGCYRDIASIHGTYRRVEETIPAIKLIGKTLNELKVGKVHWYLDSPVSNSGRLKGFLQEIAKEAGFDWETSLVNNPDKEIIKFPKKVVISSDGWVIDHAAVWFNLAKYIVDKMEHPNLIDLASSAIQRK